MSISLVINKLPDNKKNLIPEFNNVKVKELREIAKDRGIVGRSKMKKKQLYQAIYGSPPSKLNNDSASSISINDSPSDLNRIQLQTMGINKALGSTYASKGNLKYRMTPLLKDYFEYWNKYQEEFGPKTTVFYQCGKFYEVYDMETIDGGTLGNIRDVVRILNIALVTKNKKADSQFLNCGFQTDVVQKFLRPLIEENFTVVLVRQYWVISVTVPGSIEVIRKETEINPENGTKPLRKVHKVVSPGTHLETASQDTNNLMVIYIDNGDESLCAGISVIDLTTGKSKITEVYHRKDPDNVMDEITRIALSEIPKEVVIYKINYKIDDSQLIYRLNLTSRLVHIKSKIDAKHLNIFYQNQVLAKVFKNIGQITPIEHIGVERMKWGSISYVLLLDYAYKHDENILKRIGKPEIVDQVKHLRLDNNSIIQLNVVSDKNTEFLHQKKYSLFDTVNKTSTVLGKRLLKERLLHPIVDLTELNWRYDRIETLGKLEQSLLNTFISNLKGIPDIERLHRRLFLTSLQPQGFINLDKSYKNVNTLIMIPELKDIVTKVNPELPIKLNQLIKSYNSVLKIDEMNININKINSSFFREGIYTNVDTLQQNIIVGHQCLKMFVDKLNMLAPVKINITGGRYYFVITNKREEILASNLTSPITLGNLIIQPNELSFVRKTGSQKKIICQKMEMIIDRMLTSEEEMKKAAKEAYINYQTKLYETYKDLFISIQTFVAELDFLISGATVASKNRYCKPIIQTSLNIYKKKSKSPIANSFLDIKDLRHPILERICDQEQYVSNNIKLDDESLGLIITGVNGIGKCFARDTGIIMYDGSVKKIQDISVGDLIMGDDSTPRKVLSLARGKDNMYEISNVKGDRYVVNSHHILCLKSSRPYITDRKSRKSYQARWFSTDDIEIKSKNFSYKDGDKEEVHKEALLFTENKKKLSRYFTISVNDYLKLPKSYHGFLSGYKRGIAFPERCVYFDPYILGVWLGDGTSAKTEITNQEASVLKYLAKKLPDYNCYLHYTGREYSYRVNTINPMRRHQRTNMFSKFLSDFDLYNSKHIPDIYKYNSRDTRLKLLAGLIDTNGYLGVDNTFEIIQKSDRLANDILYLVRSLGFACYSRITTKTIRKVPCKLQYPSKHMEDETLVITKNYNRMTIWGNGLEKIPVLCKRKKARPRNINKDALCGVITVNHVGIDNYYGFETDGNHKFMLDNFVVTHNSAFLKATALSVILAQIGYFVPCSSMIYLPFELLMTRIMGNDNIFLNHSSFAVEMNELRTILTRGNKKSLVLVDELSRGTGFFDAVSIQAAAINYFAMKLGIRFVLTTHLHKIFDMSEVNTLKNIAIKYMKIRFSQDGGIIYDRKLEDGVCPPYYGIEIARKLGLPKDFTKGSEVIRKRLLKSSPSLLVTNRSKYNVKLETSECQICGTKRDGDNLDTHHIKEQCKADQKGFYMDESFHKNELHNLVCLCKTCHRETHAGKIIIEGYKQTTQGRKLIYSKTP